MPKSPVPKDPKTEVPRIRARIDEIEALPRPLHWATLGELDYLRAHLNYWTREEIVTKKRVA